jgi:hypothetical protein
MATTTNNGWVTPDNTAYVKDGASAIRSLGQSIDTSVGTGLLAWTTYTPVLTSTGGTITSYTINSARYYKLGKIVHVEIDATVTNNGTGSGAKDFTLPLTARNSFGSGGGVDLTTGFGQVVFGISATSFRIANYNYTYPGVTTRVHYTYEAA